MSDAAAALLREKILSDPESWKLFVPASFVHPRTLDPNYIIPNRGHVMVAFTIINSVVASLVVGPRLFSRIFVVRSFKLDDWLIIPAFISYVVGAIIIAYGVKKAGLGKHVYDCTSEEILAWYWLQYSLNITTLTTIFITRASILCFLRSLAGNAEKKSRLVITCVQVMNCLVWPGTMFPAIFMCSPEYRNWDLPILVMSNCIRSTTAVHMQQVSLGMGVSGVLVDFAILAVPIRMVWKLKLPVRQRIIVSGLFAIGGLACIASVCKAFYISVQLNNSIPYDFSWTFVNIFISAEFEQSFALVTACGPGLKPLFSRVTSYISDTFYGESKLGLNGSGSAPLRERKAGAVVTIGSGGKRGKKSGDLSEIDSTTSIVDNGVDNGTDNDTDKSNGDLWKGDLESGQGVEGVPSMWQGEMEGPNNAWPVYAEMQEAEQIPKVWRGHLDYSGRQASAPSVWQEELDYTGNHGVWTGVAR